MKVLALMFALWSAPVAEAQMGCGIAPIPPIPPVGCRALRPVCRCRGRTGAGRRWSCRPSFPDDVDIGAYVAMADKALRVAGWVG